ncbi:hypothetical protein JTE90_026150 [Oedothorax gibbosus]|uniref:Uncharacterized protein n=1 Tax=Oedothorax gibbosus TaxID=931172 RepID=A0AAV6V1Z1_9ARAC|nr:hypothetical protein JTE90_026150 [Oedothorax gibbosus]
MERYGKDPEFREGTVCCENGDIRCMSFLELISVHDKTTKMTIPTPPTEFKAPPARQNHRNGDSHTTEAKPSPERISPANPSNPIPASVPGSVTASDPNDAWGVAVINGNLRPIAGTLKGCFEMRHLVPVISVIVLI